MNTLDEYDERIPGLMRSILGKDRGSGSTSRRRCSSTMASTPYIGEDFFANYNFCVLDDADVYIGDNVADRAQCFADGGLSPADAHERLGLMCGDDGLPTIAENAEPIHIGNNVGSGAM